jgi:hypothetical protein
MTPQMTAAARERAALVETMRTEEPRSRYVSNCSQCGTRRHSLHQRCSKMATSPVVASAPHSPLSHQGTTPERIFRAEDGLCVRSGRIAATSTHGEQELHCAIQNALADERSTVRRGRSLTCFRPSGKRPYVVHVLPSHRPDVGEPPRQAMALVLIIDPEDEPAPAAALLRRLYHLTEAEAEVALHVMHGAALKQFQTSCRSH